MHEIMKQQLGLKIAFGNGGSKGSIKKSFHISNKIRNKFVIWLFCFLGSLLFVIVPNLMQNTDNIINLTMRDHAIPLLVLSESFTILIECFFSSKKSKSTLIFHLFLLVLSIICYFAYFATYQNANNSWFTNHAIYISPALVLFCLFGEIIFLLCYGE